MDGQMSEEGLQLGRAQLLRMAFPMEQDVFADPAQVTLLRAEGVMFSPQSIPGHVEELGLSHHGPPISLAPRGRCDLWRWPRPHLV